jgi:hypothetical protein
MYAIDPTEFQYEIYRYEIAKKIFDQLSPDNLNNLETFLSIKVELRQNEKIFAQKRERRKIAPIEYENIKNEYWSRGAGYNVEYLKIQRDQLKQEIVDLENILIEPDRRLNALYESYGFFKSFNLDIDFYESFTKNYQKYEKEITFYSVFKLIEGEEEKAFSIVPKSVADMNILGHVKLITDQSALGRFCLSRSVGEKFCYVDGDGSKRDFEVITTRLMKSDEIDNIIQKRNRNLVADESAAVVDLNGWISNNSRYRKGG